MGILDFFKKLNEKRRERKEEFEHMKREFYFRKKLEDMMKTPAEKEIEFYERERRRENLNKMLQIERKRREEKMKKLNSNLFNNRELIFHNNKNLIKEPKIKWI